MRTIKQVQIEPVFVETIPDVLEQRKIYISEKYGVSLHLCLCGCGEVVSLPFNNSRFSWTLTKSEKGISFTPSVGNYSYPCKSHYIITDNTANFV